MRTATGHVADLLAELQKGEFHLESFSNGITNANGVILFSGTRGTIQSLSAETGGGKVTVTGFGAITNGVFTFGIDAQTRGVRVRYPEGVSSISDADVNAAKNILNATFAFHEVFPKCLRTANLESRTDSDRFAPN